jgi:NDP-sugar pyrophosphorylase family protein
MSVNSRLDFTTSFFERISMINIVVPFAGMGSRFAKAGYKDPKPLILVHGVPMLKVVIDNLRPRRPHKFIFICLREHAKAYGLADKLQDWAPGSALIEIDSVTEGTACTVLKAKDLINNDVPLMIANSDQYVEVDVEDYLDSSLCEGLSGLIMTMEADDPKWSFAATDKDGLVQKVAEKEVISHEATVGIYNFTHGRDFVAAAEDMIARGERVNGEFYVAPVYNRLIAQSHKIRIYNIGSVGRGMHGLGTPADLDAFLALPLSLNIGEKSA